MKKVTCIILCIFLCICVLSGCSINTSTRTLDDENIIPEDGIITAQVFNKIKDENRVSIFYGESNGYKYEWTIFGSDIDKPKDMNLLVNILEETDNTISYEICSKESFDFMPVLSIYSSKVWNADGAIVKDTKTNIDVCSASITGSKTSVLNYPVSNGGFYTICVEETQEIEVAKVEEKTQTVDVAIKEDKKQNAVDKTIEPDSYTSQAQESSGQSISGGSQVQENKQSSTDTPRVNTKSDDCTSISTQSGGRVLSDGKQTGQDQYKTDPVPEGKPLPVEPENQKVENKTCTCTFSIECTTIFNNLDQLADGKLNALPSNGIILAKQTVTFNEGESVFDVLQRVCRSKGIQLESSFTPLYNSAYIEGINNLYEFDCGDGSGWMYRVNGWYPNYGCSRYQLQQGDVVEWRYTCDLGADVGGSYAI